MHRAEQSSDLLAADEAAPVEVVNAEGASPLVVVCEHAGRLIPRRLGDLGLDRAALASHIAWDLGAEAVARGLAALLDAPLVVQRYSRLVYDCNRPPEAASAMAEVSEATAVPGNAGLGTAERQRRAAALYYPFHAAVDAVLDAPGRAGLAQALVTVHSFTPVYLGRRREVELGILHDADRRLADAVLAAEAGRSGFVTRRNEPYGPADGVTHTLNMHAPARRLPNVMIEIRNDLIADQATQAAWAERLARLLVEARAAMTAAAATGPGVAPARA